MTVISKITTQKKNTERYNIFLDEGKGAEYAFSVDEAVLVKFQLRKGLEITREVITEILYEDMIRKGYQSAINYLSYRMRSIKEVVDYLGKKEIEGDVIRTIIERLTNENYLNDEEFAKAFVRTRLNLTLKGPRTIRRELIEKGVSEKEIDEALKLYSRQEELEKASVFLQKKYPKTIKLSRADVNRKMYTLLLSNGFSNEVVQEALALFDEQREEDTDDEWEAIKLQGEKAFKKYRNDQGWEKKQKVKQFLYRRGFTMDLINKYIDELEED